MTAELIPALIDDVNKVAVEYLKGKTPMEIAKEFDMKPAKVTSLIREWKDMASNSDAVRARAREALAGADLHYNRIIAEAYKLIDEANDAAYMDDMTKNQSLTHRATALKMIADLEAKRISMLHQAGLLENQELADQLIEQERKQETITKIIMEVVGKCKYCKPRVLQRMSGLDATVIVGETVD